MLKTGNFNSIQKNTFVGLLILILLTSSGSFVVSAQELTGPEIIQKVDSARTPETVNAILTMKLVNKEGKEKIREMEAWKRGNDSSVMVFKKPESVTGIALLKTLDDEGEEKAWLYLPSLNMTRTMNEEPRNRKFMGSDFTYDDLGARNTDEYTYELLRVENSTGEKIYVVEGVAKDPEMTGYSKIRSWINGKYWNPEKVEYYDLEGELLKVQKNSGIEKIGNYWVVKKMVMENKQTGSKTVLTWKEYQINVELPETIFEPETLPEFTESETN